MKHYFMTFFILFSALSSSWVGAVVFSAPQNNSVYLQQVLSEQEKPLPISHCSSMQLEVDMVQKVDHEYCANCFDQCQCENSICHKMNSSLVGVDLDRLSSQGIANIPPIFAPSRLQNAPVFLDFRPPKYS